ncbi:MAG: oligosaccharide flippase family protein [Lachnospiraceae bacterium]|nr:oligosaccharide flippase family protein [Lachnospiraceae bacterium]
MNKFLKKYNSFSKQAKAAIWFFAASFIQKGISTISTPIFTRLLSTEEFGQYNVFNSWLGIITVFVTLNLFYGVYEQGLIKFESDRNNFMSSLQGLECLLIIISLLIYTLLRKKINLITNLNSIQMYSMFLIMWSNAVYNFWAAGQRVVYKYKKLFFLSIIAAICQPILCIVLIRAFENKVTARILGIAIVNILSYTAFFFIQISKGKFYKKKYWIYAFTFNIPLIPHYLSQTILISSDRIMIEKIDSSASAGIYSLAYSIAMLMTIFNTALNQTLGPWTFQKIKEGKIDNISGVSYKCMFGIGVLNLMLIAFAPELVSIFAPISYHEAIYVIPPIAISTILLFAYDQFGKFEFYYEKTQLIALATAISAVMNIVLNYIGIRIWGYIAAGYTTLICYLLYAMFHFAVMNRICKERLHIRNPYNWKLLLLGLGMLILCSGVLVLSYKVLLIRIFLIGLLVLILFLKRNAILSAIKFLEEYK